MEIVRSGKWNPGGGLWLELLPAAHVSSYTRASLSASPVIALIAGVDWTRIYCTQGTLQYKDDSEFTDNGAVHSIEIKGFSPDDSPAKALAVESLFLYEKFLVRFRDNAGLIRVVGSNTESLSLTYSLGTDPDVPGQRGYSLNLKGSLSQRPAYA